MANTYDEYISGKAKWFFHNRLDLYGTWSHVLYPDQKSLEIIRELQAEGVKNQLKKDDDGYYIRIRRPTSIELYSAVGKKTVAMEPPRVVDADGKPVTEPVGNGSLVTTRLEVYTHKTPPAPGSTTPGKAKAMRWGGSRIDDLIPYQPKTDRTQNEIRQTRGLDEQPEQLF
jgi:hypothetical protein